LKQSEDLEGDRWGAVHMLNLKLKRGGEEKKSTGTEERPVFSNGVAIKRGRRKKATGDTARK